VPAENLDKETRRRLKNRRSAARSNARKKERNELLVKDLRETNQAELELRHQEAKLRAENMDLLRRLRNPVQRVGDAG
jgi:hypothetical protein